jgi:hypothetical protein
LVQQYRADFRISQISGHKASPPRFLSILGSDFGTVREAICDRELVFWMRIICSIKHL